MKAITKIVLVVFSLCLIDHAVAIQGGQEAAKGEFPYMVSIRNPRNVHICGGTIIGETWVLSSNPCYSRSWFGYVRYGSNLLDDEGQLPADRSLNVISVNESLYNPQASDLPPWPFDCVLIRLNEPIPFSNTIYPVKLPSADQEWPYNRKATILGWGKPNAIGNQLALQKTEVPLYSDEFCDSYNYNGWNIPRATVMKCGGVVNVSYHCYNDYGGPVIVDDIQYGILSYVHGHLKDGSECGDYPNIYSPVSAYRNWIQTTTGI
ncbi:trypsin-like [Rhynchophorus ferrugineus]|uniref:trypsin-like n=1 Tax=Rhynchophorus ferrugineus TaxID=354439 RepID=UPI003FCDFF7D